MRKGKEIFLSKLMCGHSEQQKYEEPKKMPFNLILGLVICLIIIGGNEIQEDPGTVCIKTGASSSS